MENEEVKIRIPESNNTVITPGFEQETKNRFEKIDQLLFAIVASVIISAIGVFVAVVGLFIDQMRFNNAGYKEYSDWLKTVEELDVEKSKLEDENKKQLEIIYQQQIQISNFKK